MTNRITHRRFGSLVAFALVLTLLTRSNLFAANLGEYKVAIRPTGIDAPPVTGIFLRVAGASVLGGATALSAGVPL